MGYRYDPQRDWPPDYSWRNKKQDEPETRSPLIGVAAVVVIVLLMMGIVFLTACTGEGEPIEMVKWDYKERCSHIWNKPCSCVETPTEEWMQVFKC